MEFDLKLAEYWKEYLDFDKKNLDYQVKCQMTKPSNLLTQKM